MKLSKIEASFVHLYVRRSAVGTAPFTWEVHGDGVTPIHVSTDRYPNLNAAYEAGQARFANFIASANVCQSDRVELDLSVLDTIADK